jgi:hypothetical protein
MSQEYQGFEDKAIRQLASSEAGESHDAPVSQARALRGIAYAILDVASAIRGLQRAGAEDV